MIPQRFTPKLYTLLREGYGVSSLKADAMAGLTVAIVALPLAMALGIASGATPEQGLLTAIVAGFFISALGGSRVQIGGPTGAFVVIIAGVIAQYGFDGLALATLLAGVILIVAGYAQLGQIIRYIPHPVITGFTAGIAVIIASSQVRDFLGLPIDEVPAEIIPKWAAYFAAFNAIDPWAVGVGAGSLFTILLLRRFAPRAPGYLIAVLLSALFVAATHAPVETIGTKFGEVESALPSLSPPAWDFEKLASVTPAAFTIAFLAGIEALLSAVVADGMTGYRHRPNQELVGQGVANLASALFGGLPATGAIARTAANVKAGGRTPVAGIIHSALLMAIVYFFSGSMTSIPLASLAAILFVVAWGMSEHRQFVHLLKLPSSDRAVMLLTFLLTVFVDLTAAIGVGVTIASLLFMKHMSDSVSVTPQGGLVADALDNEQEDTTQRTELPPGVEVFRITGPLFFGVSNALVDTLHDIGQKPEAMIIRMKQVPYIDASGAKSIREMIKVCRDDGIKVVLSSPRKQPLGLLKKAGVFENGDDVVCAPSYDRAIEIAQDIVEQRAPNPFAETG
ncbi:C4-dicarboxylic acid transporter DauA [Pseudobythopirellula maris]|uniref:C4-dicarboxylic acid transporter DauA n=1 Tax=Pseudobythopirellula maris TaxID=2527991 RepID=A0A5C5ZKJ0_9BACT|nr:sulfate permease [Pseudobythopirellula maris]TWT86943.1 C4-dicarboxylic acid transporter DauA [Pseudobythopirellula maris]